MGILNILISSWLVVYLGFLGVLFFNDCHFAVLSHQ